VLVAIGKSSFFLMCVQKLFIAGMPQAFVSTYRNQFPNLDYRIFDSKTLQFIWRTGSGINNYLGEKSSCYLISLNVHGKDTNNGVLK